jgi:hypothetical protein
MITNFLKFRKLDFDLKRRYWTQSGQQNPRVKLDQASDSPIFFHVSFRTDARWDIRTRSSL